MANLPRQETIPNLAVWQEPRLPLGQENTEEIFDVFALAEELRRRDASDEEIAAFEQEFLAL